MTIPLTFGTGSGGYLAPGPISISVPGVYNQCVIFTVYQKEAVGSTTISCTGAYPPDLVKLGEKVSTKGIAGGNDVGDMRVAMFAWTPQVNETRTFVFSGGTDVMGVHYKTWQPTTYEHVRYEFAVATGQDLTGDATWSAALTPIDLQPDDNIFVASIIPTDVTTPSQFSADTLTAAGITFTAMSDQGEPDTSLGMDLGGSFFQQSVVSGSGVVSPTVTATVGGTLTNVYGPSIMGRVRAIGIDEVSDDSFQAYANIAAYSAPTYVTLPDAGAGLLLNSTPIQEIPPGSEASVQFCVALGISVPDSSGNNRPMSLAGSGFGAASALMTDPGYDALVLAKAPAAYWKMDNVAGSGGAVNFSGGYAMMQPAAWMDSASYSITAKIRPTALGSFARNILSRYAAGHTYASSAFAFRIESTGKLACYNFIGGGFQQAVGLTTLAINTTYNVAVTYDGTNMRLYVNGVLDLAAPVAVGVKNTGVSAGLVIASDDSADENFVGSVDVVAFYPGTVLTAGEVAALNL